MRRPPLCVAFARFVLATLLMTGSAAHARGQQRPFYLPEEPYDYTTVRSPYPPEKLELRSRNCEVPEQRLDHLATLGRVLFYEKALSRNGSRSCASCHEQARGFANSSAFSSGFRGQLTKRNSMSIANLRQRREGFFWDGRAETLEEMVLLPIHDPIEMGLDLETAVERLRQNEAYFPLFGSAFGGWHISAGRIGAALAEFVRALVSLQSKYDFALAIAGSPHPDFAEFTDAENRGKQRFFAACASCHMQRFSAGHWNDPHAQGDIDPRSFEGDELVNNGVDIGMRKDDPGLAAVSGKREDRGRFRVPTLRNIELTGPYMHDGRFVTLEEVVHFYAHRVRPHDSLDPRLFRPAIGIGGLASASVVESAPSAGIALSPRDQADLVAFLRTLTDREFTTDPRFSDPFARRARAAGAKRHANE